MRSSFQFTCRSGPDSDCNMLPDLGFRDHAAKANHRNLPFCRFIVEMEVVMPEGMTVRASHDIALILQHKVHPFQVSLPTPLSSACFMVASDSLLVYHAMRLCSALACTLPVLWRIPRSHGGPCASTRRVTKARGLAVFANSEIRVHNHHIGARCQRTVCNA